jgi:hypothetical protein
MHTDLLQMSLTCVFSSCNPAGRDGPGAASPGRALQGVRDKLDAYYAKQQQQQRLAAGGQSLAIGIAVGP